VSEDERCHWPRGGRSESRPALWDELAREPQRREPGCSGTGAYLTGR
jgi:hypothetical protein